jgi:hypothetical protein
MSLGLALSRVANHLATTMKNPPARIGGVAPAGSTDVPALVLSISDARLVPAGIGDVPGAGNAPAANVRRPVLVETTISLADPVIHDPGGDVPLLLDGGTLLRLPHSGLVHRDGTAPPPALTADDIKLTLASGDLTLVGGAPQPGQFRIDRVAAEALEYGELENAGVLRLGAAPTGTNLVARYYLAEYERSVIRCSGQLAIDVVGASTTAVEDLSAAVAAVMRRGPIGAADTAYVLAPSSWSAIGVPEPALGNARRRTLTFRFDLELADIRLPGGGGVISRIDVKTEMDDGGEPPLPTDKEFSVPTREESP